MHKIFTYQFSMKNEKKRNAATMVLELDGSSEHVVYVLRKSRRHECADFFQFHFTQNIFYDLIQVAMPTDIFFAATQH